MYSLILIRPKARIFHSKVVLKRAKIAFLKVSVLRSWTDFIYNLNEIVVKWYWNAFLASLEWMRVCESSIFKNSSLPKLSDTCSVTRLGNF